MVDRKNTNRFEYGKREIAEKGVEIIVREEYVTTLRQGKRAVET